MQILLPVSRLLGPLTQKYLGSSLQKIDSLVGPNFVVFFFWLLDDFSIERIIKYLFYLKYFQIVRAIEEKCAAMMEYMGYESAPET